MSQKNNRNYIYRTTVYLTLLITYCKPNLEKLKINIS